jgi:integrase
MLSFKRRQAIMNSINRELSYLFTSSDGHVMACNTPSMWFRSFLKRIRARQRHDQLAVGIPESKLKLIPLIRFHDLRHTHATLLIAEGIDIQTIKNRLGHARASTTANIYCHPLKAKDVLAAELIESILIKK